MDELQPITPEQIEEFRDTRTVTVGDWRFILWKDGWLSAHDLLHRRLIRAIPVTGVEDAVDKLPGYVSRLPQFWAYKEVDGWLR